MLATLFSDGRETRMGAQGIVISFPNSSAGLGDYGGGYDFPDLAASGESQRRCVPGLSSSSSSAA